MSEAVAVAVAGEHKVIARDGTTQALSNITWAFAKLGYNNRQLFESVAGEHERIARDGSPQTWR